jgi:ABC-type transporter MlaC component
MRARGAYLSASLIRKATLPNDFHATPRRLTMKRLTMKHLVTIAALAAFAAIPLATFAAQDEAQRQITQQLAQEKLKLTAAEKAQGSDRDKLMQEHMKMMQETMGKMQVMKPRRGMTIQEQEEWIAEHQKLMGQMMGQMMDEHHMMTEMKRR